MNAFDFFLEQHANSETPFLVGKEEINYRALYQRSAALASWINGQIGEDREIILISPNNLFFIVVYLAILKSGNRAVPLNPKASRHLYDHVLSRTSSMMVFADTSATRQMDLGGVQLITSKELEFRDQEAAIKGERILFKDKPETGMPAGEYDQEAFHSDRIALIIFTSGSTGEPKGVMLTHKNLIANTRAIVEYLRLRSNDRVLVVLPFYYSYGLSQLHTHLRAGGSLVLNNAFIFLGSVIRDLQTYDCTGFAGVPSHYQLLLRKTKSFRTSEFPALRYVTQAGGKLPVAYIDEFRESHPNVEFFVMYGQTEATARLSYLPPEEYPQRRGSIGKGIPGVDLKVVNESGNRVLPGETGEIIAMGENVMAGYYRDQEATDKVLQKGWLYTGDLAVTDEDGFIYIESRKSELIKVGGNRVSPREIEDVISTLPGVIHSIASGRSHPLLGEEVRVSVYISAESAPTISEESIKEHCSAHLELFKVPSEVEIRTDYTMSATGK